jgi:hypothetical protein
MQTTCAVACVFVAASRHSRTRSGASGKATACAVPIRPPRISRRAGFRQDASSGLYDSLREDAVPPLAASMTEDSSRHPRAANRAGRRPTSERAASRRSWKSAVTSFARRLRSP